MKKMMRRKSTLPVLKGSFGREASAVEVWGSHSRFPPLPCPRLRGLWDHCLSPAGATLSSLGGKENRV